MKIHSAGTVQREEGDEKILYNSEFPFALSPGRITKSSKRSMRGSNQRRKELQITKRPLHILWSGHPQHYKMEQILLQCEQVAL